MANSRATWGIEEMDTGLLVAQGDAPTADEATLEATHYALMYGQDGPVRYWVKQNRKTLVQGSLKGVTVTVTPNAKVTGAGTASAGLPG